MTEVSDRQVTRAARRSVATIRKIGPILQRALVGEGEEPHLEARIVGQSGTWVTFVVRAQEKSAAVRVCTDRSEAAGAGFAADVKLSKAAAAHGLAAHPQGYSHRERFVLCDHVDGVAPDDDLTTETVAEFAGRMGDWLGRLASAARVTGDLHNWWDVLTGLDIPLRPDVLGEGADFLQGYSAACLTLARNDESFDELVDTGDERGLMATGFPRAMRRPQGWDVLLMAGTLVDRFPTARSAILSALADAFCVHTGENPGKLTGLASLYVAARDGAAPRFADHSHDQRIAAFHVHLRQSIGSVRQSRRPLPVSNTEDPVTCRDGARSFGFVDAGHLSDLVEQGTLRDVRDAESLFLAKLPRRPVEGSCLYHTTAGCMLPDRLRSTRCKALQAWNFDTSERVEQSLSA